VTNVRTLLGVIVVALLLPVSALAKGGHYTIEGGTEFEQSQVKQALDRSLFNWDVVTQAVTIKIEPGHRDEAWPGLIYLDPARLDWGLTSWGTVQHEFAHQVDFFVLTDAQRADLTSFLGAASWLPPPNWDGVTGHDQIGRERFASTFAWTFWPDSWGNDQSPRYKPAESGAVSAEPFKAKMVSLGLYTMTCRQILLRRGHYVLRSGKRVWAKATYRKVCV
jgi:hypothetical protein